MNLHIRWPAMKALPRALRQGRNLHTQRAHNTRTPTSHYQVMTAVKSCKFDLELPFLGNNINEDPNNLIVDSSNYQHACMP